MDIEGHRKLLVDTSIIQNVKIIVTDKEKVIFSYPDNKEGFLISNVVLDFINKNEDITMENNVFNRGEFSVEKKDLEIGEIKQLFLNDDVSIENYTAQMIAPVCVNDESVGSIIFYREKNQNYPGKNFAKSKLQSIKIAKYFLEEFLVKEISNIKDAYTIKLNGNIPF